METSQDEFDKAICFDHALDRDSSLNAITEYDTRYSTMRFGVNQPLPSFCQQRKIARGISDIVRVSLFSMFGGVFLSSQCCSEGLPSLRFMDTVCATNATRRA